MGRTSFGRGLAAPGFIGSEPATRRMVHLRTHALAAAAGRSPQQITHADYLRARRELTGESDFDRQDRVLDASCAGTGR